MTRSSARRRNRNARMIVALASGSDVSLLYGRDGAFTADSARRLAHVWNFCLFRDVPPEVNWPLCAELLNRKARRISAFVATGIGKFMVGHPVLDRIRERHSAAAQQMGRSVTADYIVFDDPVRPSLCAYCGEPHDTGDWTLFGVPVTLCPNAPTGGLAFQPPRINP